MTERLKNKVAIVTGAGAGIGQGCAIMFAGQGATVYAVDIDAEKAEATASKIRATGGECRSLGGVDLTSESQVNDLVDEVSKQTDSVDVLLNAAAFGAFAWIEEMTHEQWKKTLSGELDIVFLVTKALWPFMKKSAKASVINFASANAYQALESSPALAHCAGKGGVLAMTRQLAMEGAPHGIRANTISPGLIHTEATAPVIEQIGDAVMAKSMLKRIGQPKDIAYCATYLASDEASFVTAADFSVDAGATSW